jgi:signal transduction histidine kinase
MHEGLSAGDRKTKRLAGRVEEESGRVAAEAVVVATVLVLFVAGGARGPTGHALVMTGILGGVLATGWCVHYVLARVASVIPRWYPFASVTIHGLVVGWHALALMAPAEPLFTSYLLLVFLALHSLRLSPTVVLFAGGLYAAELAGLGVYLATHGTAGLIDAHPLAGVLPGTVLPLGMVAVRPVLLLAATACLWWLVRTVDHLLTVQATLFREREETLAQATRELERIVQTRTNQWRAAVTDHARLAERERIAQQLHDGLAKSVAGLALELGALAGRARSEPALAEELDRAAGLARQLVSEARNTLAEVREPLGLFSLPDLLKADARLFSARTGIEAVIRLTGSCPSLPDGASQDLRDIVAEALDNAARHSAATCVQIGVESDDEVLTIVVEDNGHGLAHDVAWNHLAESRHYGLLGIRERSRHLGADCRIAAHGRLGGVSVRIHMPVPPKGMVSGE